MPVAIDSSRPVYHGIQHLGNVTYILLHFIVLFQRLGDLFPVWSRHRWKVYQSRLSERPTLTNEHGLGFLWFELGTLRFRVKRSCKLSHMKCETYMFLICLKLLPPHQDPKCVRRSLYRTQPPQFCRDPDDILHTRILGGPRVQVAQFGPKCSRSRKMAAILHRKKITLFSQSILVTSTKLERDIAKGKVHLVCEFDLKRP